MRSIAEACSSGKLSNCSCDKSRRGEGRISNVRWKWGGCSNNIRYGMLFAKHYVEVLDAAFQYKLSGGLALSQVTTRNLKVPTLNRRVRHGQHINNNNQHFKHVYLQEHRRAKRLAPVYLSKQVSQQTTTSPKLPQSVCNSSLSKEAHKQLVKSVLTLESLEAHQNLRLSINMHNNKAGRMVSTLLRGFERVFCSFFVQSSLNLNRKQQSTIEEAIED